MNPSSAPGSPELHAAVAVEAEALAQLACALEALQMQTEARDSDGLDTAVDRAREAAEDVARAGGERMRRTNALARSLAMGADSTLTQVAARAGGGLESAAAGLLARLQRVARASASLGICARFGAASCERLQALQRAAFGLHDGYGADGRLGGSLQGPGRRA